MTPDQTSLYWRLWRAACQVQGWKQSDREIRMEAHRNALGKTKSSKALTNTDLDQIYAHFRLLADPDDIRSQLTADDPTRGQLKRYQHALGQIHEAMVIHVCRDKFGTRDWKSLNAHQSGQLLMTCKRIAREQQHRRIPIADPVEHEEPEPDTETELVPSTADQPF